MTPPLRFAVLASGSGSNLAALMEYASQADSARWEVSLVLSDRPTARALERARARRIETGVLRLEDRAIVAEDLLSRLEDHGIDGVLLAGFLRLVPTEVVDRYEGRILNIHPALLPAFGGKGMYGSKVHEAVLAAGVRVTGVTVHRIDLEYDRGTIVAQHPVPVRDDDTPETLAARVLETEHWLFPRAADHLAEAIAGDRSVGPMTLVPNGGYGRR